ncbi:MAG TPA: hydrogen gas-evolving membrane-bound hydrogenase subunit E [Euzebyales bacterium]|nr:hydrogen gas-evolving membrane-bound hydrogenase subunit E [Euzebyales bacterium]
MLLALVLLVVAVPFVVSGILGVLGGRVPARWAHRLAAGVMLALFGAVLALVPAVRAGGPIVQSLPWVPDLGLSLEWYVDGLALLFALLITGIGAAVFAYAGFYMDGHDRSVRFAVLLSGFAGSMLGVVLAGNLLALFVCWELTSVFSFLLIGFERDDPRARSAAVQALVVTGGGGLALLVGLVLISVAAGTSTFADLVAIPLQDHPWYAGITVLVLVGCFTKSAQMPAHFWLPAGMTAPTPASAYLHSATMVKAGVYLLARFWPTLGDTPLWTVALVGVGTATMLCGAAIALRQRDLKALLAYATVSWLGALVLLLGLPDGSGYQAAMVGIVAHALYKSPLFMVAGVIDHATGTRMIDRLGGLARPLPAAAAVSVVSGLSMAGVIPLLGFVAKEGLLEAVAGHGGLLVTAAVSLAALLTVVAALIFVWDVFFAPAPPAPAGGSVAPTEGSRVRAAAPQVHVPPALMLLGPGLIAALSLVVGLLTDPLVGPLVELASPLAVSVHLFHGFTAIFALSLGLIAAGVAVFSQRGRWRRWPVPHVVSGQGLYDACRRMLNRTGDVMLRLQDGKLSHYLAVLLGVVGVLIALPGYRYVAGARITWEFSGSTDVMMTTLLVLAVGATLASIMFRGHLLAALALGVAGYAVGGVFLLEPAPDVAMVQIVVETLGAVLIIVMLSRISERKRRRAANALWGRGRGGLRRDVLISTLVGLGVGAFTLTAVVNRPARNTVVADWYLDNAQAVGVRDVVGSIITDFRATDTLVEITVFAMAALGVLTVLHLRLAGRPPTAAEPPGRTVAARSLIETPLTRYAATLLFPVAVVIALAHLLYAGDAPGDGFTAGVIGGISVALWYQVFGYGRRRMSKYLAANMIGGGMALAISNGLLQLVLGRAFLAHDAFGDVPLVAGLHFSSATVLEVAIALTVFGSVITMLNAITTPEGIEQL